MYQRFCDHPVNVKEPSDGKFRSSSVVDGSYSIVIGQHIQGQKKFMAPTSVRRNTMSTLNNRCEVC